MPHLAVAAVGPHLRLPSDCEIMSVECGHATGNARKIVMAVYQHWLCNAGSTRPRLETRRSRDSAGGVALVGLRLGRPVGDQTPRF